MIPVFLVFVFAHKKVLRDLFSFLKGTLKGDQTLGDGNFIAFLGPRLGILENRRSWRVLTGEIALLEIRNVFAEVSICPERMKLLQKSSRETHFEATATCFEYSMESQGFRRGTPGKPVQDRRKSLGTLRNRAWVPESILSKDVHESTWGAFLSSRWTF